MILITSRLHLHAPHSYFISQPPGEARESGGDEGKKKKKKQVHDGEVHLLMVLTETFSHLTTHYIISLASIINTWCITLQFA